MAKQDSPLYAFWGTVEAITIRLSQGYGPSDEDMRLLHAALLATAGMAADSVSRIARAERLKADG
jgi:hypothetical protein